MSHLVTGLLACQGDGEAISHGQGGERMGREVPAITVSQQDRRRYREKVRRCLDVLARMLRESRFDTVPQRVGLEIEFNLVDEAGAPSMKSAAALKAIDDPGWGAELGQFNLEINVPPRTLSGDALAQLEDHVRASVNRADRRARDVGCRLAMIGILPTLSEAHVREESMSEHPRYWLLNEQIFAARGEDVRIQIEGPEHLLTHVDNIMPEAACTSVQCHLQVSPEAFGRYWNAAQAVAGVQVALAANSPFLFGKELWRETRITLFQQATDTRPEELQAQGVRPRVWFGERWITSVFDLFEENIRYFPALLPLCEDEDPVTQLEQGGTAALAEAERPIWTRMSFAAAGDNLFEAARHGIDAHLYWPGLGVVPATELTLRSLLPLARDGLRRWGVGPGDAERSLGIIEQRCLAGRTGATWQADTVHALERGGRLSRTAALRQMTQRYIEHMHTNEPVHTWPTG